MCENKSDVLEEGRCTIYLEGGGERKVTGHYVSCCENHYMKCIEEDNPGRLRGWTKRERGKVVQDERSCREEESGLDWQSNLQHLQHHRGVNLDEY
jgi:hypothetical protein